MKNFPEVVSQWPQAANNYAALEKSVLYKDLEVGGFAIKVQCNPARIVSSLANIDPGYIARRPCFLCKSNMPEHQKGVPFYSHTGGHSYEIVPNPFPIFKTHLTIPAVEHTRQEIGGRFEDMLDLAQALPDFVVFYNGPASGASAPDHMHFQAGEKGFIPIEHGFESIERDYFHVGKSGKMSMMRTYIPGTIVLESPDAASCARLFYRLLDSLPIREGQYEPMLNIFCWTLADGSIICVIFNRCKHRPDCYYEPDGPDQYKMTPGCVDLSGVLIIPRREDFDRIDGEVAAQILSQVCDNSAPEDYETFLENMRDAYKRKSKVVRVLLSDADYVKIRFLSGYQCGQCDEAAAQTLTTEESFWAGAGKVLWRAHRYDALRFMPGLGSRNGRYEITVADRRLVYSGSVDFVMEDGRMLVIANVEIEKYIAYELDTMDLSAFSRKELNQKVIARRGEVLSYIDKGVRKSYDVALSPNFKGVKPLVSVAARNAVTETFGEVIDDHGHIRIEY